LAAAPPLFGIQKVTRPAASGVPGILDLDNVVKRIVIPPVTGTKPQCQVTGKQQQLPDDFVECLEPLTFYGVCSSVGESTYKLTRKTHENIQRKTASQIHSICDLR
jgi:hypothetical protein